MHDDDVILGTDLPGSVYLYLSQWKVSKLDDFCLLGSRCLFLPNHGCQRHLQCPEQFQPAPDDHHLHLFRDDCCYRIGCGHWEFCGQSDPFPDWKEKRNDDIWYRLSGFWPDFHRTPEQLCGAGFPARIGKHCQEEPDQSFQTGLVRDFLHHLGWGCYPHRDAHQRVRQFGPGRSWSPSIRNAGFCLGSRSNLHPGWYLYGDPEPVVRFL